MDHYLLVASIVFEGVPTHQHQVDFRVCEKHKVSQFYATVAIRSLMASGVNQYKNMIYPITYFRYSG